MNTKIIYLSLEAILKEFLSDNFEDGETKNLAMGRYSVHVEYCRGPGVTKGYIEKDGVILLFRWDLYSNRFKLQSNFSPFQ